ncbi:MAG TPA: HPr(Ser) kinase/phosphatase [Atopostipes sp.]|nr:HPr(Ser) kinase/phosphatase [Atopostipes sp.]
MGNTKITVQQMVDEMPYLSVVSGGQFLDREIYVMDVSRPALELTGYFDYYPQNRIQLFGATEISFINRMTVEEKTIIIKKLCQPEVPAFLVSRGLDIPEEMIQYATEKEIPVILSNRNTTRLNANVMNFLEEHLAERDSQHGVLVEIYGMGVMITGESGIGKSETALELIERGHRLVADDRVELYMMDESRIIGEAPEILRHLIEIRGVGVIDIMNMFGVGSVRDRTVVDIVINLKHWDNEGNFDRLGNKMESRRFFNVDVPLLNIPVRVGRNLATIIEVAAMNVRAKELGYDATAQFESNLSRLIEKNKK